MSLPLSTFPAWGRKIVAIGRNYAEHAKELGNAVPTTPFFFLKPTSSYVTSYSTNPTIEIPKGSNVHHEVELAVVIGANGRDISEATAMRHVEGYALAIDATARDLQDEAKKAGKPWSTAKGFDTFTPIGDFIPKTMIEDPDALTLWLKVNDTVKQNGPTSDMIFKIPQLISYVSSIMTLERGDVILTGTPAGVGRMNPGDIVTCGLRTTGSDRDIFNMKFSVVERPGIGLYGNGRQCTIILSKIHFKYMWRK
ncbi:hypothetical protein BCR33DRAFT_697356 [Rhizoclosmatium globosum]|uniref:Fumarylacetoacetase-like C-terminal domain-containing protein n=1 Tax=Rhizoclosmatium globosum TaxID=329046 RepID=A0A1Y2CG08_9FUNG|nr:hypothetical protein BCR33DRAFT_697356 [Rhizoclosmatium globosum]|eukprot:ORY45245.1 hypothetical protein BCR33DRAFT_697356 [Rhizoclosmatium globosum]